ncbi:dockerin type I domain-containing protein [Carnobacterium gallinarum]|uniref:dockerin type I domain-containing protein n=1 Tax=Carnobacterium gallinarum TaxID=2749 RepID=UPI000557A8DD|nr:dockerin type I domain-containing protein [Carnobacterium gallinarum]
MNNKRKWIKKSYQFGIIALVLIVGLKLSFVDKLVYAEEPTSVRESNQQLENGTSELNSLESPIITKDEEPNKDVENQESVIESEEPSDSPKEPSDSSKEELQESNANNPVSSPEIQQVEKEENEELSTRVLKNPVSLNTELNVSVNEVVKNKDRYNISGYFELKNSLFNSIGILPNHYFEVGLPPNLNNAVAYIKLNGQTFKQNHDGVYGYYVQNIIFKNSSIPFEIELTINAISQDEGSIQFSDTVSELLRIKTYTGTIELKKMYLKINALIIPKATKEIDALTNLTDVQKKDFKNQMNQAKTPKGIKEIVDAAKKQNLLMPKLIEAKKIGNQTVNNLMNITGKEKSGFNQQINQATTVEEVQQIIKNAKARDQAFIIGDLNSDRIVNSVDAALFKAYVLSGEIPSNILNKEKFIKAADFNKDNRITIVDYASLKLLLTGN